MALTRIAIDRTMSFVEKNRYIIPLFSFCIVAIVYFSFSSSFVKSVLGSTSRDYYPYLIDSFLHGRTDILAPSGYDLSFFNHKKYLYYGPAPIILIFPFYILAGIHASDILFTLIGGISNVVLFYFAMRECKKHFNISLSPLAELFLILSFGLASPNFYLSLTGGIWFTCQVFATTYLLLFYLFYFKFLNTDRLYCLVLAMLFFCLTVLTRLSLVFHAVMFLYLFVYVRMHAKKNSRKTLAVVALVALAFIGFEGVYNYVRFGSPLETGLRYHVGAVRYAGIVGKNMLFSLSFMPHNFYYYFIHGVDIVFTARPVVITQEGNSVFSVYPALLLLPAFLVFKRRLDRKMWLFLIPAAITTILSMLFLMCFFATGWIQFGSRYFLDILPLIFLTFILILRYVPRSVLVVLLAYGVFVNVFGLLALYGK